MSVEANIKASNNVFVGEDKNLQFTVTDADANPQTMTGWALEFVVRSQVGAGTALLTKTTGGGTIALSNGDGTDDRATVTLTDTDTLALGAGDYRYALRRTTDGNEQVLAYGTFVIRQAATR